MFVGVSFVYSLCVCVVVCVLAAAAAERESASFVSFFSFTSSIFLIFYAWNALLISSGPPALPLSFHPLNPWYIYNISLIITQKIDNLLWMLCVFTGREFVSAKFKLWKQNKKFN